MSHEKFRIVRITDTNEDWFHVEELKLYGSPKSREWHWRKIGMPFDELDEAAAAVKRTIAMRKPQTEEVVAKFDGTGKKIG